ncbi:MAG: hypothetical protein ABIJ15_05555 [bacterium]
MLITFWLLPVVSIGLFHACLSAAQSASIALTLTVDPYPPGVITALSSNYGDGLGEIALKWIVPSDDGTYLARVKQLPKGAYIVKRNRKSPDELGGVATSWWENTGEVFVYPEWIPQPPGFIDTKIISDFTHQEIYNRERFYFAVRSVDKAGNESGISNIESAVPRWDITPPTTISDLVVSHNGNRTGVVLEWSAPKDVFFETYESKVDGYIIRRATVSLGEFTGDAASWWSAASEISPPAPAEPGTGESIELNDLTGGVTYYFAIKSFDEQGNVSEIDALFTVREGIYVMTEAATPNRVSGIWGEVGGNKFIIHWSTVEKNNDGTTECEDLAGYYIRCSPNPFDAGVITATVGALVTSYETYYSTSSPVYYYSITAFDGAYPWINESEPSMLVDSSDEVSLWLCSQRAAIRIPKTVQAIMRKENNSYGDNIDMGIERITGEEKSRILCSYEFAAVKNVSKESAGKFVFRRPYAEIRLYYSGGSGPAALQSGDSYSIMWYNGKEWLKLGGDVNKKEGFVSVKTERIGKYQLRRSIRATKFTLVNGPIPKIITPNGDGLNDFCEFFYDNPQNFAPAGKIFDITGAFVTNMANGPLRSDSSGSLRWNGFGSSGQIVRSGIYIYQIDAGGEVYNGTVVVAR